MEMNDCTNEEIQFKYQLLQQEFESLKSIHEETLLKQKEIEFKFQVRLRTMQCHNQISEIQYASDLTNDEFFEKIVRIVPSFWQFSEFAQASVRIFDKIYSTPAFAASEHRQKQSIKIKDQAVGSIEIGYRFEKFPSVKELFLNEEKDLLFSVAERIADFVERHDTQTQARKLESELDKQEALNQSILAASPDAIAVVNLEGKILYASSKSFELFRAKTEFEILNRSIFEFIHPDDRTSAVERLKNMGYRNFREPVEYRAVGVDGSVFIIEVNGELLLDGNNKNTGIVLVVRNITERRLVEQNLVQSEQTYRSLVESISEIVFEIGIDGVINYISPAIEKYINQSPEEMIGQNFFKFVHPDDLPGLVDIFKNNRFDKSEYIEYRMLSPENKMMWVQVSARTKFGADGKPIKRTGIIRDITDLKIAEDKLKNSEEKYRGLVESINDVIYEIRFDGTIQYISPAIERLIGYTPEELSGKNFLLLVHPDNVSTMTARLRNRTALKMDPVDFRFIAKDGNLVWVRSLPSPLFESGKIIGRSGIITNISAQKQTELELKESEELYRSIITASPDSITIADLEGHIKFTSPKSFELFGGTLEDDYIGHFVYDFIDPDDQQRAIAIFNRIVHEKVGIIEYKARRKDGSTLYIEVSPELIIDQQGNPSRILLISRDITEKRDILDKLSKSEESFRNMVENINDVVYEVSVQGIVTYVSPSIERILGYDAQNIIGKSLFDYMHIDDRPILAKAIESLGKVDYSYLEYRYIAKSGDIRWVRSSTKAIYADGNVVGGRGVLLDISEQKFAEEEMYKSSEKYKRLIETISDVIFEVDSTGKLLYCSPSVERVLGYLAGEVIGKNIFEYIYKEDLLFVQKSLATLESRPNKYIEYRYVTKDGSVRWVRSATAPKYEYGVLVGGTGSLTDITEQKLAEIELRKLSEAVKQSPVSIVLTNLNGNIEYANPKACETTGYTFKELYNQNPRVLKSGETPISEYEYLWDSISHGNVWRGTFHNKRKNGELYWESSQITPILDNDGKIINYLAIKEDITERKKMQEDLMHSESRFREITEQSQNVIWETNQDAVYTFVSRAAEEAWGLKPEDLVGKKHFFDIHPEEGRAEFIENCFAQISAGRQFIGMESQVQGSDGKINWVLTNGMPILDANGNVKGYRGSSVNINGQKQAFQALQESEERYKSIFRESKSVMLIIDPENGTIVDANERAAAFYGWTKEEIGRKKLADIDTISEAEAGAKMKETLSGNQKEFFLKHKLADGTIRDVEIFAGPISFRNKKHLFGIIHDVTERRIAEESLLQRERDLNFSQEIAGMGSWQVNMASNTSRWSDNMYRIFDLDPEKDDASQELFFELVHPDDRQLINTYLNTILRERKPVSFEMRMNLKSGKTIWIQNSMVPGFDGDQLVALYGTNVDITEKKKSENALREREEQLNQAQEMAGLGSWSLNVRTTEMKWSENYFRMMGMPVGTEVNSETFLKRVHPDDLRLVAEFDEKMRQTRKAVSYDIRVRFEKQQYRWIQNNIVPFFDADEMVLLKGVFIDITDKKLAEERINNQNETLNAIVTAIPDLMFVIDKNGNYLEVFASESEKLLISPEKIIGSNINEAFSAKMAGLFLDKIRESISKNTAVTIDYVIALANSPSTDFEARIVPIDQEKVLILSRDVTEKAVREKELKRLSTAVQQSPVITVVTDLKAKIEYVNPAFEQITGYTLQEVIGKNPKVLQSGFTHRSVYKDLWAAIKAGKTWHGEWMNRKKSGEYYWEDVTVSPITDEAGKPMNYLAVKQDITQRKRTEQEILELNTNLETKIQERTKELAAANFNLLTEIDVRRLAEKALTESEEKYRSVVENVKEVIFITDADGNWVFLNQAWTEITGFSLDESIGRLFVNYVHPDDRAYNWELFEPLIKREKEYCRHEIRYLTKNGGFRWVEVFARLKLNEDNEVIGTLGTLMDVTERKRAEEMVFLQKRRLESVIEGSSIGTWEWNVQTGETIYNDKWAEIMGYSLEELAPVSIDTWTKFTHPDDWLLSDELLEKHFKGETDYYICESRMKHKNGGWVWVLDSGKVISWSDDGKPLWMFGSHLDITERKKAEIFENELLQLSPKLTGISISEIDPAINLALSKIGTFLNADRSYIFEFNADHKNMNNTFEWCNGDIKPQIEKLQNLPTDMFPNWMNLLHWNENVVIPSVSNLPESWRAEREILEPQGVQSLIAIPLLAEQKLVGFVGLDSVKTTRTYNKLELNTLTIWSSILSSLINNKRTETLIEQTRQNYQTFFNTIDDFLIILDHSGKIVHANETFYRRLGYTPEELASKTVIDVRPLERREETTQTMSRIMNGETDFCSIPFVTRAGVQIPVETRIKLGFWNGESRFFAVSKDISQIKLSEEKFSAAFRSSSAMMAISSISSEQLMDVNDAFVNQLGYSRQEAIGQTIIDLEILQESAFHIQVVDAIKKNIEIREQEIAIQTKNKEERIVLFSATPIFIGDQRCVLKVMVDITERKKAENELLKARLEAETANKAKSEFLSRMSHELRTPMNSILGFAQLLEMSELNLGQKKGVTHILKSGRHLLDLINEVLDISRIEAGRISLSIEPIKLSIIIPEMLDILAPMAQNSQVNILFAAKTENNVFVRADRQRLKQVLLNVINNAIKYNKKNGSVSISVEPTDGPLSEPLVRILISDTGIGIKHDDISRLFNPFERIGADKTETEGTGLGLAVAKKLVEAMGGALGVESQEGLGSQFWIELPRSDGQLEQLENLGLLVANEQKVEIAGKILYVEDNPSNVELVEQILLSQRPGIQMATTANGLDAVKLAVQHSPHLILLDLNLPDVHGSTVLEHLLQNEQTQTIPVVIISADAMPSQLKRLITMGAKEYITKPLDIADLLRVVDKYIERIT